MRGKEIAPFPPPPVPCSHSPDLIVFLLDALDHSVVHTMNTKTYTNRFWSALHEVKTFLLCMTGEDLKIKWGGWGSNSNPRDLEGKGFAHVPAKIWGSDFPLARPGLTTLYDGSNKKIWTCQVHPYSFFNCNILYNNHRQ